jgi:molybdopterin biosynthesis enzyme
MLEINKGEQIMKTGFRKDTIITAAAIGFLPAWGDYHIKSIFKLKAAILVTGNELAKGKNYLKEKYTKAIAMPEAALKEVE